MLEVSRNGRQGAFGPCAATTPSVTTTETRGHVPDCNLKSYIENVVLRPYRNAEHIEPIYHRITAMRGAAKPFQMDFTYPLSGAVTDAVVGHLSAEWCEDQQLWDVLFIAVENVDVCTRFFSPDQVAQQLMKRAQALRRPAAEPTSHCRDFKTCMLTLLGHSCTGPAGR